MKARAFMAALLVAVASTASDQVAACGDKYLNLGLGTRFERSASQRRAAAVLLYAGAGSDLSQTLAALAVEDGMRKAGYQPARTTTAAEFDAVLGRRTWDVIVLDNRDLQAVSQHLPSGVKSRLVPVLARPTKDELKQVRRSYEVVLASPTKSRLFVEAVDDALDLLEIDMLSTRKKQ